MIASFKRPVWPSGWKKIGGSTDMTVPTMSRYSARARAVSEYVSRCNAAVGAAVTRCKSCVAAALTCGCSDDEAGDGYLLQNPK